MTCPVCTANTTVTHTFNGDDNTIRFRQCVKCGYRFKTVETDEDIYLRLQKGKQNPTAKEKNDD